MRISLFIATIVALGMTGCQRPASVRAPQPVRMSVPPPQIVDGSLWQNGSYSAGYVADTTARNKGDIIQILVIEDTHAKRERSMDRSKASSIDAGVSKFLYSDLMKRNGELPSIKANATRSSKGDGSLEDTGSVKTTISAQVVDVMANGNLILLGQKEVVVQEEAQVITLTGIARPQDVLPNNSIISTKLAEARISITGSGPLDATTRRSLVARAFDWVNLF